MKKIALLFTLAILFISCEGPQGSPGFDGINGDDSAQSYEFITSFTAPDYESFSTYPFLVDADDMALVYILWDVDGTLDVWRLLPQTVYTDFGEFQYNYDATSGDVRVFLDSPSTTDFSLLSSADLDNQIFRVVILPAEFGQNPLLDVTDYNAVMDLAGLQQEDIITIE